jgi:cytidine deaminase
MGPQVEDWDVLTERARAARKYAYAPYSQFAVGGALVTASGEIFTGCNVENVSLGLTVSAGRVAVFGAASTGFREFVEIALAADVQSPLPPCGVCRQVLAEDPSSPLCGIGAADARDTWVPSTLSPSPFVNIPKAQT